MGFKELELSDLSRYYAFTNRFPSYSDLNFTSLWCWSTKTDFLLDDTSLIVRFEDYSSDDQILTGLSTNPLELVPALLKLRNSASHTVIDTLPEVIVKSLAADLQKKFKTSRDQDDYLYKPSNQIKMEGHAFAGHRRKLAAFKRLGLSLDFSIEQELRLEDERLFKTGWMSWKEVANKKEPTAIERYVDNFQYFTNQYVYCLRLNGEREAFAFCEVINGETKDLLIHFFKSNKAYPGLSDFLFFKLAEHATSLNIDYINFEQDVGEPGLRYYKEHLRPDKMLQKYSY